MKARKIIAVATVALFFLIAALPLYGMLIPGLNRDSGENRALAQFPSLKEMSPETMENWFDDHFALRADMTKAYNLLNARSGVEVINGVAVGKDGFLYYMYDGSQEDIQRSIHYSQEELDRICEAQQAAADYLAEKGIGYYLMVCPDKHTVYPEYLPDSLAGYEGPSRFDGMLEALRENTTVKVIDARDAVIAEKKNHTVFLKTDTHWNAYGAFVGYDLLMDAIQKDYPNVRHVTRDECTLTVTEDWLGGDMAGFIGQGDTLTDTMPEYAVNGFNPVFLPTPYAETSDDPERPVIRLENPDHPERPSAVIFRDSFCRAMYPMLADSFSKVTFAWSTSVLNHIVEVEQPDLVIMEYVERYSGQAANGMDVPGEKLADYENGDLPMPEHDALIRSCVDSFDKERDICTLKGWAFRPGRDAQYGDLHIALVCGEDIVWAETSQMYRPDVTAAYESLLEGKNVDAGGFSAWFDQTKLHTGKWELIAVIDDGAGSAAWNELGKHIKITE